MTQYERRCRQLQKQPQTWLITGVAGFIGSNVVDAYIQQVLYI